MGRGVRGRWSTGRAGRWETPVPLRVKALHQGFHLLTFSPTAISTCKHTNRAATPISGTDCPACMLQTLPATGDCKQWVSMNDSIATIESFITRLSACLIWCQPLAGLWVGKGQQCAEVGWPLSVSSTVAASASDICCPGGGSAAIRVATPEDAAAAGGVCMAAQPRGGGQRARHVAPGASGGGGQA